MFTTGFTMDAEAMAQPMDGPAVHWIRDQAVGKGTDIVGSMIISDGGRYFNRLIWARADGDLLTYDKRHLFRMMGEDDIYTAGEKNVTVNLHGWRIRPFICYDLRFPAWTRNVGNKFDVALFVANWPGKRFEHWKTLLAARAIENQCYVVGVNRVGVDGLGNSFRGDSSVVDPMGNVVFERAFDEIVSTQILSRQVLDDYRESFPAWKDADREMFEPG
jgi:predicted amidohydrolase